ncbi:hypothetical protein GCM10022280_20800 [Sphingomonas swuensis]|uniref:PilZ domain-containing protein n=1 Tax=Sphingomonas swuensis TaxID=977800 RepID=A0ABP7T367_9SPHN
MDESGQVQNRRQRRSNVLLSATLEAGGRSLDVKLRNLSAEGALVEGDVLPVEGAEIRFRRQELVVGGTLVWVRGSRAGVSFHQPLSPEALLRHVPTPRPRVAPDFRRPGLAPRPLTDSEQRFARTWTVTANSDLSGK